VVLLVVHLLKSHSSVRIDNGVVGTFTVVQRFGSDDAANGTLVGVLAAPGVSARDAERKVMFPSGKRPLLGTVLPVMVDPLDPTRFNVLWDRVPTARDVAAQQASQIAAQMVASPTAAVSDAPSEPGVARVLSAVPTGDGRFLITLEVHRPGSAAYHVQITMTFATPGHQQLFATPGSVVPVLIDPAYPLTVIPDMSRTNDTPR